MIYLDNSATTRPHSQVIGLMTHYMEEAYGNPSSLHHMGLLGEKAVKKSRQQLLKALGSTNQRIVFTSGGTEADNLALIGGAFANRRQGNQIITSQVEHPAVLQACKTLEKEGFEVVYLPVDRNGLPDLDFFRNVISHKTCLISIMHVNNEVGTVFPVREIAKMKGDALLHLDCVQSFGKLSLMAGWADLISISGHKIHGPKGSGCLCLGKNTKVTPQMVGGGQEQNLRSGTENVPAIAGFGLAAEMAMNQMDERSKVVGQLKSYLLNGILDNISDVLINTPENSSPYILNISFLGTRGEVLLHQLEQNEIYVSTGAACSSNKKGKSHVLTAMGRTDKEVEGALRFSFSEYNTMEEMEVVLDCLKGAVTQFRKLGSFR